LDFEVILILIQDFRFQAERKRRRTHGSLACYISCKQKLDTDTASVCTKQRICFEIFRSCIFMSCFLPVFVLLFWGLSFSVPASGAVRIGPAIFPR